ncbi:tetratricopeptide repeat protein [Sabulilitoribacter multivorans]|uniref:Tetratricopeptide repeat protein n=1 Tax=Flaviramulus multivorans TaxID=1304750 RepID=A0ABS9IJV0_9FLAO|nr:tetratricopeptide repeat protein [Flaviramulus multivorans]MCF7560865.1 tetratricopeptide repeat protein [Flaviramulus multivorans]
MKKRIIIALALSISAFSFAQKKELKAAEKAIKNANFSEAKQALKQVEPMLASLDEKLKSTYYLLNAEALFAKGNASMQDIEQALSSLKNVTGNTEEVGLLQNDMLNSFLSKGNKAYEEKNYKIASNYFESAYNVRKTDTVFLYYAAATSVNIKDYDRALELYGKLKDLGYTGIEKEYYAIDKETGKEEVLDKNTRDIYVKSGSHIKPGERLTESKLPEIVKNIALIYVSQGDNEKALAAMKEARAESPEDINLILSEANVYYKMGNTEEFKNLLQQATKMDPTNPELQYNLGVISAESNEFDEAKAYYEKAIELDPDYVNAYINISALILSQEQPIIDEMNGLGTSKADDKRYDELREKRQGLYRDAIPYLKKALDLDSENLSAAKTLMNIYSIVGETDKYKEMKVKVDAIEGGQ